MRKYVCVLIFVIFTLATVTAGAYTDVDSTADYYNAVIELSEDKVITGYEDGTFKPFNAITRAEATTIAVRAMKYDVIDAGLSLYDDVPADNWACPYILAASHQGIVNGMGDGTFAPGANVTHNQIIKIVVSMTGDTELAEDKGGWPLGYAEVAHDNEIIDDNTYNSIVNGTLGNENANRADVARYVYNATKANDKYGITVSGTRYYVGMNSSKLPEPAEKLKSVQGYTWYVYDVDDYKDFFAAGVENGKVVVLLSTGRGFTYRGVRCGDNVNTSDLKYSSFLYSDVKNGTGVHSVMINSDPYRYNNTDDESFEGEAKLNFHLANAYRAYHGLTPYKWSDIAAKAAFNHSKDMGENNYFDHQSLSGTTPADRLKKAGLKKYRLAAENITAGSPLGFMGHVLFVNSSGHRENLLGEGEYMGVGMNYTAGSRYDFYTTQNFYK